MRPGRWARPPTSDVALGLVLSTASIAHVWLTDDLDRSQALLIALSVLTAMPLAWRRTAPLASAMVIAVFFVVLVSGDYPEGLVGTLIAVVVSAYSVGAHVPGASAATIPLGILLAGGWYDDVRFEHPPGQYLSTLVIIGMPWVGGRLLRRHRLQSMELQRLTEKLEAQRDQLARAAVVEERSRIARELHDVVAHSISVIAVQAGGARSILRERPDSARESIEVVRQTSRDALAEMRRILKVLRGRDGGSPLPQPSIRRLPQLVREVEHEGTHVQLNVEGAEGLPEALDLNTYRIVQEALTNVRKHAGPEASADVSVSANRNQLTIVIRDNGSGSPDNGDPSHGLLGIRERAQLFGGTMKAGDRAQGGFEVQVRIPVVPSA